MGRVRLKKGRKREEERGGKERVKKKKKQEKDRAIRGGQRSRGRRDQGPFLHVNREASGPMGWNNPLGDRPLPPHGGSSTPISISRMKPI